MSRACPSSNPQPPRPGHDLLIERARAELSAEFDFSKPMRVTRAPGRLDIMGGVAELTGSCVCQVPIDRAVAVLSQERADREIQVFSFNLFDQHKPFTFRMPLDRLARCTTAELRTDIAELGRKWAAYVVGCLAILHQEKCVDLANPSVKGINFAVYGDVPMDMGLGSSSALTMATMRNLAEHFGISEKSVELCKSVERDVTGNLYTSYSPDHSFRLPSGFQIIGISSGGRDKDADERLECHLRAAPAAHAMIFDKMRDMGRAASRELVDDPMRGHLANLDPDDYKKFFRSYLLDSEVLGAADHHVLEARRVRQFLEFVEQARSLDPDDKQRYILMDKAGHLMYASHLSYMNDARLGSEECDLLVKLVREREKSGLYGARITGRGCGGTVAALGEDHERANIAIREIMEEFRKRSNAIASLVKIQPASTNQ